MCTLTWFRDRDDFELLFNRDEARDRAAERPPRVHESDDASFLAPTDSEAGGSWIAANAFGLVVALLNGDGGYGPATQPDARSRGLLVRDLASCHTLAELDEKLPDLEPYSPFVLVALDPRDEARWEWNGKTLRRTQLPSPVCSSGVDPDAVRASRASLLSELQSEHGGSIAEILATFHASHARGRNGESPCVHRKRSATRSFQHIRVSPREVEMLYSSEPPCRGAAMERFVLPRVQDDSRSREPEQ